MLQYYCNYYYDYYDDYDCNYCIIIFIYRYIDIQQLYSYATIHTGPAPGPSGAVWCGQVCAEYGQQCIPARYSPDTKRRLPASVLLPFPAHVLALSV